jgi:hypothetical protein
MAKQTIALGTPPSGVGGDTPRSANIKVNANFDEVYDKAFGLGGGSPLVGFVDANTLTTQGEFALGGGGTNLPVNSQAFWMRVLRQGSFILQEARGLTSDNAGKMYIRAYTGSAWSGWERLLNQSSITGTVSQSGGIPTGAIMQSSGNANGSYIKFADGTLICCTNVTLNVGASTYYTDSPSMLFPHAFQGVACVVATAVSNYGNAAASAQAISISSSGYTARGYNLYKDVNAAGTCVVSIIAMGRWY